MIKTLILGDELNKPINCLPNSLESIIIGSNLNSPIKNYLIH